MPSLIEAQPGATPENGPDNDSKMDAIMESQRTTVAPDKDRTASRGHRRASHERDEDMTTDPQDVEWPQSDGISVKSMENRTLGNWTIDTTNPDGWTNTLEFLKTTSADFVLGHQA